MSVIRWAEAKADQKVLTIVELKQALFGGSKISIILSNNQWGYTCQATFSYAILHLSN